MPENDVIDVEVWMHQPDLSNAPVYALPDGYSMRFYRDGDVQTWLKIQRAADPDATLSAETFHSHMPDESKLPHRVMFMVDPSGADIGSITAWDDDQLMGREMGLVHWVAIVPKAQGNSLAKPLLSTVIEVLKSLNYTEAWLETNTKRIPAINLYLSFGFKPYPREKVDRDAWRAVAPRLKYPIEI